MKDMTSGGEARHIIYFAVPMLIGNLFQQAYSMADGIIVGRYVGEHALAAVGTSFPILFLMVASVLGLALGAGILLSQLFGANNLTAVRRATTSVFLFASAASILLSVIGYFLSPFLLKNLLDVPDNILNDSIVYLRIFFLGLFFMYLYNFVSAVLRSVGDSKTPLYFLIVSTIINIVLDIYFVANLKQGVAGVAWATFIAQAISAIASIVYVYIKVPLFRFKLNEFVFDRKLFYLSVKIGIPSSIQQTVLSLGFIAVQRLVNGFGAVTIAAVTAASRIDQLAIMPVMNIGMALSTFAGQNIGAGKPERAEKGYRKTLVISAVLCLLLTAVVFIYGKQLIGLFIRGDAGSSEVIRQGTQYLQVVVCFYLLFSIMNVTSSLLRGCGDVFYSTYITLIAFGLRLVSAYLLVPYIGYRAIWWSMPIGWFVSMLFALYRYKSGKWKDKALVKQDNTLELNP